MNKSISFVLIAVLVVLSFGAVAYYKFSQKQNGTLSNEKVLAGLSSEKEKVNPKKSCCSGDEEMDDVSENSIYQVDAKWTDQSGSKFLLSDLKGKKVVLAMIFANCTYACPLIVNDMKKVESALSDKEKQQTEFVLVSIDPERDTPEALSNYAKSRGLDLNRWKLLTGSQHEVRELAAMLGFKYKKNENGDYAHSNLINILNKQGDVVYQHEGLNKEVDDITTQVISVN